MFRKAERKRARLRLGIVGPSGSGKTFGALVIARGIGGRVALIDTENGSGELYSHLMDYDVCTIHPPFEAQKYLAAIAAAEKAGYDIIIIDSLSHAWAGDGGLLDMQGKIADSGKRNGFAAWRSVTPLHNRLVDAMLQSRCHIIATMRAKTEYALQDDGKGGKQPVKIGLAPVQRDGMDYEFTVVLDVDVQHNATSSKDRTGIFDGRIFRADDSVGKELLTWLESGALEPQAAPVNTEKDGQLDALFVAVGEHAEAVTAYMLKIGYLGEGQTLHDLPDDKVSVSIQRADSLIAKALEYQAQEQARALAQQVADAIPGATVEGQVPA